VKDAKLDSYQDLVVWQTGMEIAAQCYFLTRVFPREELFGPTSQIRRASSGIPANIAEGYGRGHRGEYIQFLRIAQGSLKELETHLLLAIRVELLGAEEAAPVLALCDSEGRMLGSMIRSLGSKHTP
jgi:four helix bundle protein